VVLNCDFGEGGDGQTLRGRAWGSVCGAQTDEGVQYGRSGETERLRRGGEGSSRRSPRHGAWCHAVAAVCLANNRIYPPSCSRSVRSVAWCMTWITHH